MTKREKMAKEYAEKREGEYVGSSALARAFLAGQESILEMLKTDCETLYGEDKNGRAYCLRIAIEWLEARLGEGEK